MKVHVFGFVLEQIGPFLAKVTGIKDVDLANGAEKIKQAFLQMVLATTADAVHETTRTTGGLSSGCHLGNSMWVAELCVCVCDGVRERGGGERHVGKKQNV